ncbi:MAG: YggL family protein [Gammaproteobacteria bacterium]|nr:YggL family protein [Gammaproteobacteria bacterium]
MARYNRSRRLDKKLRVGEFTEYGFKLGFSLNSGLDDAAQNAFFDAFMGEGLEQKGLAFFGFDDNAGNIEGFVTLSKRGSVGAEQRDAFEAWLKARGEVSQVSVGELKDANEAWA